MPFAAPAPLTSLQRRIAIAAAVVGALLRLVYIVSLHPPMKHVYSDMGGYLGRARALLEGRAETIGDSLYPPGMSRLLALLLRPDPDGGLVMIVQWLSSLAVMAGLWWLARRLYGNAVAVLTLVVVALYLPLFHYAGLLLAENPFTALMLGAWVTLVFAMTASVPVPRLAAACAAGLLAGLAATFKATILLPVALTGPLVLLLMWRARLPGRLGLAAGVLVGLALVLVPSAERCTRLAEGNFCLVSTNTAMNALMGHAGDKGEFVWTDPVRGTWYSFTSPSASLRGHRERVSLHFGVYDVPANLAELRRRLAAEPGLWWRTSLRNVRDLVVGRAFWPGVHFRGRDWSIDAQRLFRFVLLPLAALWLLWRAPLLLRLHPAATAEWLLAAPLLGLVTTAAISLGEVRFRIPFDGFAIILAAQAVLALTSRRQRRINRSPGPPVLLPRPDRGLSG